MAFVFALFGVSSSEKRQIVNVIQSNGATYSYNVCEKVTHILSKQKNISGYQESLAKKYGILIVMLSFLDDWIIYKEDTDITPHLLYSPIENLEEPESEEPPPEEPAPDQTDGTIGRWFDLSTEEDGQSYFGQSSEKEKDIIVHVDPFLDPKKRRRKSRKIFRKLQKKREKLLLRKNEPLIEIPKEKILQGRHGEKILVASLVDTKNKIKNKNKKKKQVRIVENQDSLVPSESEFMALLSVSHFKEGLSVLGHTESGRLNIPTLITFGNEWVKDFSVGNKHSGCVTLTGKVFTWGKGKFGTLGHGNQRNSILPKLVEGLPQNIIQIGCGHKHTAALTETGEIWQWGCGEYFCLGHEDDTSDRLVPARGMTVEEEFLELDVFPYSLVCGNQITAILTVDGQLFTWGNNEYRLLGNGETVRASAKPVQVPLNGPVKQVAFGQNHAMVVLYDGRMYSWGRNDQGQCGVGHLYDVKEPSLVFCDHPATFISCGPHHSACTTVNGDIFVWGHRTAGTQSTLGLVHFTRPVQLYHPDSYQRQFTQVALGTSVIIGLTPKGNVWKWPLTAIGVKNSDDDPTLVHTGTAVIIASGFSHLVIGVKGLENVALQYAREGALPLLKNLVETVSKSVLRARDENENTLLHFAASKGDIPTMRYLYQNTEKKNIFQKRNGDGQTAIHLATEHGHAACIPVLAEFGVPLDTMDNKGNTALHLAVSRYDLAVCNQLLKSGADLNQTNEQGKTPLHLAVSKPWPIIELLVKCGPNLRIRDKMGYTPLTFCSPIRAKTIEVFSAPNVIISYGHDSRVFVTKLSNFLNGHHVRVAMDLWRTDADFRNWNNFHVMVFVISPGALHLDACRNDIENATAHSIQIVPVWHIKEGVSLPGPLREILSNNIADLSGGLSGTPLTNFIKRISNLVEKTKQISYVKPEPRYPNLKGIMGEEGETGKGVLGKKWEVRIFVSSTFKDMKGERDILVKSVFPRLHAQCASLKIPFSFVDLRWGISDEMSTGGLILQSCLDEVAQSYPFFVCMLGERYGWHIGSSASDDLLERAFDRAIEGGHSWLTEFRDRSVTELEVIFGALRFLPEREKDISESSFEFFEKKEDYGHDVSVEEKDEHLKRLKSFFYLRHPSYIESIPSGEKEFYYPENYIAKTKVDDLKERINRSGLPVRPYRQLRDFENRIFSDLSEAIHASFPADSEPTYEEREAQAHDSFAEQQVPLMADLQPYSSDLHEYINSAGSTPLVVLGEEGCGKSALLTSACVRYRRMSRPALVVGYFVGSSERSYFYWELCRHVIHEIKRHFNLPNTIPQQQEELVAVLPNWLTMAHEHGGMLLFIDALDHLLDLQLCHKFDWFPHTFPSKIQVVLSAIRGSQAAINFTNRGWKILAMNPLQENQKSQIIEKFSKFYVKNFSGSQFRVILSANGTRNSLYLRLLLDELCIDGSYETLDEKIKLYLGASNVQQLYTLILARWEENLGRKQVETILCLILVSRGGLQLYELLDITQTPHRDWMMLYLNLKGKIVSQNGLLLIYQQTFIQAIKKRYPNYKKYNSILAEYFSEQPLTERLSLELPYLYRNAGDWSSLKACILRPEILKFLFTEMYKFELCEYWKILGENLSENVLGENFSENIDMVECYKNVLDSFSEGHGSYEVADAFFLVGELLRLLAKFNKAEDFYLKALEIQEKELASAQNDQKGSWAEAMANTLDGMAINYQKLSKYKKAEEYISRGIHLIETNLNPHHVCLVEMLCDASVIYGLMVELQLSEEKARRALEIAEENLEPNDPDIALALQTLSIALKKQKRFEEASPLLKRALHIRQKVFGTNHSLSANTMNNLGNLNAKMGLWTKALEMYTLTGQIHLSIFGPLHHHIAQNKYNIGRLWLKQGIYDMAHQYLSEAAVICGKVFEKEGYLDRKIKMQISKIPILSIPPQQKAVTGGEVVGGSRDNVQAIYVGLSPSFPPTPISVPQTPKLGGGPGLTLLPSPPTPYSVPYTPGPAPPLRVPHNPNLPFYPSSDEDMESSDEDAGFDLFG